MSELRLNTAGQTDTYRFVYASTGNTIKTGITATSVTVQVIKIGSTLTTIAGTTTNFISVIDGIYTFVHQASNVATPGDVTFAFKEDACLPFEMHHSVITVKDWDYRYSTAAASIDEIKVDTASCVVAIASVRANMGYASTETAIKVDTASLIIAVASVRANMGYASTESAIKVDTASLVVAVASVRANMGYASTEAAIKVETASILTHVDNIASVQIAVDAINAGHAQASSVAAIKVETASILTHVDNIGSVQTAIDAVNAGHAQASFLASVKVETASILTHVDNIGSIQTAVDALPNAASVNDQVESALISLDIAQASDLSSVSGADVWSAQASVYASVGSMGELLNAAGAAGDPWAVDLPGSYTGSDAGAMLSTMSVNVASNVVAIASVLANYAQASSVSAVKVDTASLIVAVASVRANMGYASTEAAIKVDTASTVVAIASVLSNYAQASTVAGVAQASATTAIKVETASMLAKIDIIDTVADAIKVDTASTLTYVDTEIAAIKVETASILTHVDNITSVQTAIDAILIDTGTTLNDKIDAIQVDATSLVAAVAALNNISTAQVNAEMVDALATDSYAEPGQVAPSTTTSISQKIGYMFKFMRNKFTQTSTTASVYADDASTVNHIAIVSDDGTVFTRGEFGSGP